MYTGSALCRPAERAVTVIVDMSVTTATLWTPALVSVLCFLCRHSYLNWLTFQYLFLSFFPVCPSSYSNFRIFQDVHDFQNHYLVRLFRLGNMKKVTIPL